MPPTAPPTPALPLSWPALANAANSLVKEHNKNGDINDSHPNTDKDIDHNNNETDLLLSSPASIRSLADAFTDSSDEADMEEEEEDFLQTISATGSDSDEDGVYDNDTITNNNNNIGMDWIADGNDRLRRVHLRRFSTPARRHFSASVSNAVKASFSFHFRLFVRGARMLRSLIRLPLWMCQSIYYEVFLPNVLLYNISWEDPRIDRSLLDVKGKTVITLASAGDNVFDALCEGAEKIIAVDMNIAQCALMELKIAAFRSLKYRDFYQIFGNSDGDTFRYYYSTHLRQHLSPASARFFDSRPSYFDSFFYRGGSGAAAWSLVRVLLPALGLGSFLHQLKQCTSIHQQRVLYQRYRGRVCRMVSLLASLGVWKALAWSAAVPTNQQQQLSDCWDTYLMECFDHLLMNTHIRGENHYYAVYLFGFYPLGNTPRYLKRKWFDFIKKNVDRIEVHNANLFEVYRKYIDKQLRIDRFNLLDHMDWLDNDTVLTEMDLIQKCASDDALMLWKSASEKSSPSVLAHLTDIPNAFPIIESFFKVDLTPTYRSIRCIKVPPPSHQIFTPRLKPENKIKSTINDDAKVLYQMYAAPIIRKIDGVVNEIKNRSKSLVPFSSIINRFLPSFSSADTSAKSPNQQPTSSSSVSVSNGAAMNDFYRDQAVLYDGYRDRMLHGRPLLMSHLPMITNGYWVDVGGGTAFNLEYFDHATIANWKQIFIVDICGPLLDQARRRIIANGWQNKVTLIERDCSNGPILLPSEAPHADLITFSYSLTMIPNWEAALKNAKQLLKTDGFIGVCDFTVVSSTPSPSLSPLSSSASNASDQRLANHNNNNNNDYHSDPSSLHQRWISRKFWQNTFAIDGIRLNESHRITLRSMFDTCVDSVDCGGFPYVPLLKCPYYVFLGKNTQNNQKSLIASYRSVRASQATHKQTK